MTSTTRTEPWNGLLDKESRRWLDSLWGKSNAGGRPNLLIQHLFDSLAVGELIWDHYLAPGPRRRIDEVAGGSGRRFLAWLCGLHDIGKATPAFQSYEKGLAAKVHESGLTVAGMLAGAPRQWRHEIAGGRILHEVLGKAWASSERHRGWVWPLVAGHHGRFWGVSDLQLRKANDNHGRAPSWASAQAAVVDVVSVAAGYPSTSAAHPVKRPSKSDQLLLSGLMIMADWIASDERRFPGIDAVADAGVEVARVRARRAWSDLGVGGGWRLPALPSGDIVAARFGQSARASQTMMVEAAQTIPSAGLLILQAPTGEGKTEAAFAAAEVLASRFGADGVFVGMPTQATSDLMFSKLRRWARSFDEPMQLALLHGKRQFNKEWRDLDERRRRQVPPNDADQFDVDDPYGSVATGINEAVDDDQSNDDVAAEWFLGSKRGLLAPFVVGTIDQLLFAATRSRHVMLRYAGLAGKVVVLDEIHAADIYMEQFLDEALWWLGHGEVPVVLLSATLAPSQRRRLVRSYVAGALGKGTMPGFEIPEPAGYPNVTRAWVGNRVPEADLATSVSWRFPVVLRVEVLDEPSDGGLSGIVSTIEHELANGGCALVIRNTVTRAQKLYQQLKALFRDDVVLFHGRFAVADRADIAADLIRRLGPSHKDTDRPKRLVVVATQVAEQSFDVDADLLITDLAPIDLLLQRAGRLHRHERPLTDRPVGQRQPKMIVTGMHRNRGEPPWIVPASERIYGRFHLLRTAALVDRAVEEGGWQVPYDVPHLVALVYGEASVVPDQWTDDEAKADAACRANHDARAASAKPYLLTPASDRERSTLDGLHSRGVPEPDEAIGRVIVRDGDPSVEVVLVRHDGRGYRSLSGDWLGIHGEAALDLKVEKQLMGGAVRLPAGGQLTSEAETLRPLDAWLNHARLKHLRILCLDDDHRQGLVDFKVTYDNELGLVVERRQ